MVNDKESCMLLSRKSLEGGLKVEAGGHMERRNVDGAENEMWNASRGQGRGSPLYITVMGKTSESIKKSNS